VSRQGQKEGAATPARAFPNFVYGSQFNPEMKLAARVTARQKNTIARKNAAI
jgi:hypothetical protein